MSDDDSMSGSSSDCDGESTTRTKGFKGNTHKAVARAKKQTVDPITVAKRIAKQLGDYNHKGVKEQPQRTASGEARLQDKVVEVTGTNKRLTRQWEKTVIDANAAEQHLEAAKAAADEAKQKASAAAEAMATEKSSRLGKGKRAVVTDDNDDVMDPVDDDTLAKVKEKSSSLHKKTRTASPSSSSSSSSSSVHRTGSGHSKRVAPSADSAPSISTTDTIGRMPTHPSIAKPRMVHKNGVMNVGKGSPSSTISGATSKLRGAASVHQANQMQINQVHAVLAKVDEAKAIAIEAKIIAEETHKATKRNHIHPNAYQIQIQGLFVCRRCDAR